MTDLKPILVRNQTNTPLLEFAYPRVKEEENTFL